MYVIPLIVIILVALAIFFSPLFAVILMVLALAGFGGVKYFGGSSVVDQESEPAAAEGQADVLTPQSPASEERKGGIWGETWPEERS